MIITAFCPACAEPRARSRELGSGDRPTAADFEVVAGQDRPVDGEPATCTKCGTSLVFRRMGVPSTNGHTQTGVRQPQTGSIPTKGVKVHFELMNGEEIQKTRELGPDRMLLITNRRIVTIDLTAIIEEDLS